MIKVSPATPERMFQNCHLSWFPRKLLRKKRSIFTKASLPIFFHDLNTFFVCCYPAFFLGIVSIQILITALRANHRLFWLRSLQMGLQILSWWQSPCTFRNHKGSSFFEKSSSELSSLFHYACTLMKSGKEQEPDLNLQGDSLPIDATDTHALLKASISYAATSG